MYYTVGVPKNFTKFTGKHLCRSLFFNKVTGLHHLFYRTPPRNCFRRFIYFRAHYERAFFLKTRSSRPEVFCKKGVSKNFTKFTGKHLCQCLFFNPFHATGLFLYPQKNTENLWFSDGFRQCRNSMA